jgi:hypothetical protein
LIDRYLEMLDVEATTRDRYESCIRVHIRLVDPKATPLRVLRLLAAQAA